MMLSANVYVKIILALFFFSHVVFLTAVVVEYYLPTG